MDANRVGWMSNSSGETVRIMGWSGCDRFIFPCKLDVSDPTVTIQFKGQLPVTRWIEIIQTDGVISMAQTLDRVVDQPWEPLVSSSKPVTKYQSMRTTIWKTPSDDYPNSIWGYAFTPDSVCLPFHENDYPHSLGIPVYNDEEEFVGLIVDFIDGSKIHQVVFN